MSDTVKLIVEIPTIDKELLDAGRCGETRREAILYAVKSATPLDDVKAEIDRIRPYNIDVVEGLEMALEILDNIGKGSEE